MPQCLGQPVDDIVEVAAVGPGAAAREDDLAHQPSVTGGVTGARDAEHAAANVDHLRGGGVRAAFLGVLVRRAHRSSPRISMVGRANNAASSASAIARSRLIPNGIC
ncbi:Uncharacterised protein [Mycobacterium tuberculosis]|uniref:Uncharacterized protein n=1 Tax=Mycobacterium tuberculosis TaxID=1773 RepID=A0A655FJ34_MYCTX|nr:Uncharacterised protein [Mycobacterium tuberculosis]